MNGKKVVILLHLEAVEIRKPTWDMRINIAVEAVDAPTPLTKENLVVHLCWEEGCQGPGSWIQELSGMQAIRKSLGRFRIFR